MQRHLRCHEKAHPGIAGFELSMSLRIAAAVLLLCCLTASAQNAAPASGVAPQRLTHLRKGINLSGWFAQVYDPKGYTKEHFQKWVTPDDIALIKAMGFDHVRLSLNPQPMFQSGQANQLPAEYLGYLDAAVKMILDHGMNVVIDIHPESDFKAKLATDDDFVEQFADFWRALAQHYATTDPERVYFEILNEPEMHDRYRWYGIETKLAAAIRGAAPRHTIIATGARWSADDDLLFVDPLRDANVIYNFHFYEPHLFTHQGANWGVNYWHWLGDLSYPSTPESAAKAAANVPDEANRLYVLRYGAEHWDAQRIALEIGQVAAWAKRWNVPVVCNEFGAYRKTANPKDRAQWLSDVRTTLEQDGMGWAMWDYSGGFGVVTKDANGRATPDEVTLRALGLARP
jgi:aryl-phospho-beta-D-glucosidase BglC (GH1 family)